MSTGDQYLGALSAIPFPPGAFSKSRSTTQLSYLHVVSEMSDGLSSGPPGVVKTKCPGVKCFVTSMSKEEHSPGSTCSVVSPRLKTMLPVVLTETLIQSSSTSKVPLSMDNTGSPVDHPLRYMTKVPGSCDVGTLTCRFLVTDWPGSNDNEVGKMIPQPNGNAHSVWPSNVAGS